MTTQGGQEHEAWATEKYLDPGIYEDNLLPGARFLYFALHELGLVTGPIPRYRLEAAVHEVFLKHNLVAGDWETLGDCLKRTQYLDFLEHEIGRKVTQDGSGSGHLDDASGFWDR